MLCFEGLLLLLALTILRLNSAFPAPNGSYISTARRRYNYLMEEYRTSIRPVNNATDTVAVNLRFSTYLLEDLDEKNQAFLISGYLAYSWTDSGLVWNPADFDGLDRMTISIEDIWFPDITVFNSKDAYYFPPTHHFAQLTHNGEVLWIPRLNIQAHCELDLSEFPFDEHVCKVVFGSWSYNDLGVNVTSLDPYIDPGILVNRAISDNPEWELIWVTAERSELRYPCCEVDVFPRITYRFTIRRRSTFTTHLFAGPSIMLCFVTPVVFLLPPGSGEKMIFGIGVVIADTLLLGELINFIPTAHPNLPLIAKYFVGNIVMASLSLAISAIIIGFWDKSSSRMSGPHAFFRLIFLGPLATLVCTKKEDFFSAEDVSGSFAVNINPEGEDGTESSSGVDPGTAMKRRFMANYLRNVARSEWRQLAVVFDRLLFVIYCVVVSILTLSFARVM